MKCYLPFLLVAIIGCTNIGSESGSNISSNSINRTQSDAKLSPKSQDTSNLILSGYLPIKIKALLGLWNLKQFYMIDKNGSRTEYEQAGTTIEFIQNQKMISKVGQIIAEAHWDYDNILNHLTTTLEKINGNNDESKVRQENKIIYLSNKKLIYQFDDPVTGNILEMEYEK